ncbi:uncharacterized protein K452DRAFT_322662, partial [Aplosporella prunicola CBS 121167]
MGVCKWIKAKWGRKKPPAPRDGLSTPPCPSDANTANPAVVEVSSTSPSKASTTNAVMVSSVKASSAPHTLVAPSHAASSSNLRERLWNKAYDQARIEDPDTVNGYEMILSAQLHQEDPDFLNPSHTDFTDNTTPENKIEQDTEKRKKQMRQLVQNGLQKIKKEINIKQGIESGVQVAMVFKEVVDKAVQASSEAALAWVGVCIGLQILTNPLTEANSNQQGIEYVVRRMNWYWELSRLLLDMNIKPDQQGLRGVLEEKVTQLYAQLLLFQMKSVCYYYRRRFRVFVRDLVKLDNWDGKLDNIKDAEAAVRQDSSQYNTQKILNHLSDILKSGESQISAIQQQTKEQEAMHETDEDNKCLKDLRVTDPRDDKKRIEGLKGGLLKDSYKWILENSQFKKWRNEDDPQSRL